MNSHHSTSKLQVAAAIIVNEQNHVLIAQRPQDKRLGGMWEFPGGKIEKSETATEALKRELREELNLEVEVQESLGIFEHDYEWGKVYLHVFIVRALGEPKCSKETADICWLDPRLISRNCFAPADHRPLDLYIQRFC